MHPKTEGILESSLYVSDVPEITVEQKRAWESGGWSLYFRDPDRHFDRARHPGQVVGLLKRVWRDCSKCRLAVAAFRARLRESAGVIISCPEYAHGVPGVLKNALDWLVRSGSFTKNPSRFSAPRRVQTTSRLSLWKHSL